MPGSLYIVATPIGNLEDITLRALRILKECDLIAAEDTRVTRKLLSHFDIHTPLISFNAHTRDAKTESLAEQLVAGKSIALVSDAGTPGVSDPGEALVTACIERGVQVVPIPGASAVISALVTSGLSTGRFAFYGFPPRSKTDLYAFLEEVGRETKTTILYESPHRLLATLRALAKTRGTGQIAVCRELTKKFEEVFRGTIEDSIRKFELVEPRGEFTLVLPPRDSHDAGVTPAGADLPALLGQALENGLSPRDAVRAVCLERNLSRKVVYAAYLAMVQTEESVRIDD